MYFTGTDKWEIVKLVLLLTKTDIKETVDFSFIF